MTRWRSLVPNLLASLALGLALAPATARAQVLEIGADGAVTTYDRPAVFTAAGAAPIVVEVAAPAVHTAVEREIAEAARDYGVRPELARAVAVQESGLRQEARSAKGALGVMQLMPATARGLGVDPLDLRGNVRGGVAHLAGLLHRFGGDVPLSLAAYNAGAGAVARFGGAPPFAETRAYVRAIMGRLATLAPSAPALITASLPILSLDGAAP